MTVEEIYLFVQFIAEREGYNKDITVNQFNLLLKNADRELLKQVFGDESSPRGYETSQKRTDALHQCKITGTIPLTGGAGNFPADYFHPRFILYGDIVVNIVTDYEYAEMKDNAILEPSTSYPIAVLEDTTFTVFPTSITSVTFGYLRYPSAPNLALKSENGIYVYDSSTSSQPEWDEAMHIDLVRIILSYLGLSVSRSDILQYAEQKQALEHD